MEGLSPPLSVVPHGQATCTCLCHGYTDGLVPLCGLLSEDRGQSDSGKGSELLEPNLGRGFRLSCNLLCDGSELLSPGYTSQEGLHKNGYT